MFKKTLFTVVVGLFYSSVAFGNGIPHFINYYEIALNGMALDHKYIPVAGSLFALLLLYLIGIYYKKYATNALNSLQPSGRFSLSVLVDTIMDFLYDLTKGQGGKNYRNFFGFLSTLFLFILVSNLTGLVPGFPPATVNMSTNLAMGLFAFVFYNLAGIKEHGLSYIKQFMGPLALLAPFFVVIEGFSHLSRPMSLALRLVGNIFGDHLVLDIFTGLTSLVFPALLLFFGLMVAVIQSFVFTLLTAIYISMAISHDH